MQNHKTWGTRLLGLCQLLLFCSATAYADSAFTAPVAGPIRYSPCPVNDGTPFDGTPSSWFSTAWAGRYSGNASSRCEGTGGHAGDDIRDSYGEQNNNLGVYAIADGVVIRKRSVSGWGNFVVIRHRAVVGYGTLYSLYAHLAGFESFITSGVEGKILVAKGQRVGTMGTSGGVPRHLHFQVDRSWPSSKTKPFWPTYTNNAGQPVAYPAAAPSYDSVLTEAQRIEAANKVVANTVNPMVLVETGKLDLDWQAQSDMYARSLKDKRFLSLTGTFGRDLNWDPAWELRWMDFNFTGNRMVRIWHATSKQNSARRLVIFLDPDTGQWIGWEQVF